MEKTIKQEQEIMYHKQKKYKQDKLGYKTGTQYSRIEQEGEYMENTDHLNNLD